MISLEVKIICDELLMEYRNLDKRNCFGQCQHSLKHVGLKEKEYVSALKYLERKLK